MAFTNTSLLLTHFKCGSPSTKPENESGSAVKHTDETHMMKHTDETHSWIQHDETHMRIQKIAGGGPRPSHALGV